MKLSRTAKRKAPSRQRPCGCKMWVGRSKGKEAGNRRRREGKSGKKGVERKRGGREGRRGGGGREERKRRGKRRIERADLEHLSAVNLA